MVNFQVKDVKLCIGQFEREGLGTDAVYLDYCRHSTNQIRQQVRHQNIQF